MDLHDFDCIPASGSAQSLTSSSLIVFEYFRIVDSAVKPDQRMTYTKVSIRLISYSGRALDCSLSLCKRIIVKLMVFSRQTTLRYMFRALEYRTMEYTDRKYREPENV